MAISKHPIGRYQVIDTQLGRKDWVKTKELREIIEEELSIVVSERMINEDINAMKDDPLLGYFAPIEYNKNKKAYYYTDKSYTIKAFGLKDRDINALMFYAKTINQYKEYEVFKDFTNAIEKVLDAVTIRKGLTNKVYARTVVQTERTPKLTGSELIPLIIKALDLNQVIEFEYQKFEDTVAKLVKLQPHLLKEDRHRWYVLGRINGHDEPTTVYALDRILVAKILKEKFEPAEFDFDQYFAHSFGITVTNDEPVDIILSFTQHQGKYLKTLKIHPTQETLIDNEAEYRILVRITPSWEFYEKILGYGHSVKVVSPEIIIEEVKKKADLIAKLYQ
jgi:predicted DNA-binding transcriptional regulator YafY